MSKVFAVYLGGNYKRATLEVHDVVFVVGKDIQSTFPQLRDAWFGIQESIHIDSWTELSHVDGYKVILSQSASQSERTARLFFVNVGSYIADRFGENHHFLFVVSESLQDAKHKAKALVSSKNEKLVHTDNLIEVDSVREITEVHGLYVNLEKDDHIEELKITNLYWPFNSQPNRPAPSTLV